MPLFVVRCLDKPDSLDLRLANRPAHLEYITGQGDKVKAGGPLVDEQDRMIGSLAVFDVATRAEVEAILAKDPYKLADLFASVEVTAWHWTLHPPA